MRLRFFIALLAIAVLAGGCAATRAERQALGSAYSDLLMEGDTARARERLEPVRDIYDKLFLMACAELTDGNLDKAKSYAERMVEMKPKIPDGRVLLGLVNRRIAHPDESWVVAFATAWKEASDSEDFDGLSDFYEKYSSAIESARTEKYQAAYEASKGTPDELLMAHAMGLMNGSAESIELALKYSKPDAPLEIRLLALSEIPPLTYLDSEVGYEYIKLSPELIKKAKTRTSELRRQLSAEFPDLMIYDLASLMEDIHDKEILEVADIVRLEEISKKDKFSLTLNELYNLFNARFSGLGLSNAHFEVLDAALTVTTTYVMSPRGIVIDTAAGAPEDKRLRLADILDNIGKAQVRQGETIFLFTGFAYISVANYVRACRGNVETCAEEEPEKVEALSQDKEHDALRLLRSPVAKAVKSTAPMATFSWPIRALNGEAIQRSTKNEVEYFLLFADKPMPQEIEQYLK